MLGIFRTPFERNKIYKSKLDSLLLQAQLNDFYNQAYKKQELKNKSLLSNQVENATYTPKKIQKPKSQWTDEDYEISIMNLLDPYVINRSNLVGVVSSLKQNNRLREFADLFVQFRDKWLRGQTNATALNILKWYNQFRQAFFPEENVNPQQVGGQGVRSSRSQVYGGRSAFLNPMQRGFLKEAVKQAGHNNLT